MKIIAFASCFSAHNSGLPRIRCDTFQLAIAQQKTSSSGTVEETVTAATLLSTTNTYNVRGDHMSTYIDFRPTHLAVCLDSGKVIQSRGAICFELSVGFRLQQPLLNRSNLEDRGANKYVLLCDL